MRWSRNWKKSKDFSSSFSANIWIAIFFAGIGRMGIMEMTHYSLRRNTAVRNAGKSSICLYQHGKEAHDWAKVMGNHKKA